MSRHDVPRGEVPTIVGPYRIVGSLGAGGMGAVYRAVRETTGEMVALKTVRAPRGWLLSSIRREIAALSQLDHPRIARVLDHGISEGLPWYAMSLIAGQTLRKLASRHAASSPTSALGTERLTAGWAETRGMSGAFADWPRTPHEGAPTAGFAELAPGSRGVDVTTALTIVRQICGPLAYLHGEGIVHRDLKPDNVILRDDGFPVIVDFGLSVKSRRDVARDDIESVGDASGTALYMAPEQAAASVVDARADLYALGCVLYELLTGRVPFLGATPQEIAEKHRSLVPARPSSLADVPADIDDLVMRLLAKNPRWRVGHAGAVAEALTRLAAAHRLALGPRDPPEPPAPPAARPYLYRPGLCGRGSDLDALTALLPDGSGSRRGGFVLIEGESGVGKTRLLLALAEAARARRIPVLAGECGAPSGTIAAGSVLHAFAPLLVAAADRCRERGRDEVDRLFGDALPILADYHPSLAAIALADGRERAPLPHEGARDRALRAMARLLGALAGGRPLLVLCDDLQWADELSTDLLALLLREGALASTQVLIAATSRAEERTAAIGRILECATSRRHDLRRLDSRTVSEIAADMLAAAPGPLLHGYLARASGGNPLFVAEYLRLLLDEGLLASDDAGGFATSPEVLSRLDSIGMPATIAELCTRRGRGLSEGAAAMLRVACVAGREVDARLAGSILGATHAEGDAAITELLARHILAEDAEGALAFSHDKIREHAYARLDGAARRDLHRRVAGALEADGRAGTDAEHTALAHHWMAAGEEARAKPHHLAAARGHARRHAHLESERHYRAYLALAGDPDEESIAARLELVEELLWPAGRTDASENEAATAREDARRAGIPRLEARSLRALAASSIVVGRPAEAEAFAERALSLDREHGGPADIGASLRVLGTCALHTGRFPAAEAFFKDAIAVHRELGDREAVAHELATLGATIAGQGRAGEARAVLREALEASRDARHRASEGHALATLAAIAVEDGLLVEGRDLSEQALAAYREVGQRRTAADVAGNLVLIHDKLGERSRAIELCRSSIATYRELGDRSHEGLALANLAELLRLAGESVPGRECAEQALDRVRAAGDLRAEAYARRAVGRALLDGGDTAAARTLFGEALTIARGIGDRASEASACADLAEIDILQGRGDSAAALLTETMAIVAGLARPDVEVRCRLLLSRLHGSDVALAERHLARASEILSAAPDRESEVEVLCQRGHLALATGERDSAAALLAQAAALAGEPLATTPLGRSIRTLGRALEATRT